MNRISLLSILVLLLVQCADAVGQTEPQGGQPAIGLKQSVSDLEEQLVYQRAFEAVVWSQPLVGLYASREKPAT